MSVKTTPDQHQSNLRNVYGTFTIEGMTISKDIRRNLDRIGSGQSSYQQVVNSDTANAGDLSGAHGYRTSTYTSYYVTFQVESGDRMEFEVDGSDYGLLVQGDIGKLSFQGTRYLGFERN